MTLDRISLSSPQMSAGILGISPKTNLGGIKFKPKNVVIFSALFILIVKIIDMLLNSAMKLS